MSKEIIHSIILILSIATAFIFPKTNLSNYEFQITAFLFIILYIAKKIFKEKDEKTFLIESIVFTLITIGVVASTGMNKSPFFFLIYFLIFSLSLLLEPIISIVATITLILFFLLSIPEIQNFSDLIPIFSLAFITPFALFLGKQYAENEKLKIKNQDLQQESMLFITLLIKNHLKNIKEALNNFIGDNEIAVIRKNLSRMEKLIDKYEKSS